MTGKRKVGRPKKTNYCALKKKTKATAGFCAASRDYFTTFPSTAISE